MLNADLVSAIIIMYIMISSSYNDNLVKKLRLIIYGDDFGIVIVRKKNKKYLVLFNKIKVIVLFLF